MLLRCIFHEIRFRSHLAGGKGCGFWLVRRRWVTSLSYITSQQTITKEYEEAFAPKGLKKIKFFQSTPPNDLTKSFHQKLNKCYSNPRTILKVYKEFTDVDDYPNYRWLVRCFCQLANTFGFNSFWSTRDKQVMHSIPLFKYLVFDLIERQHLIEPLHVPRLLYSLACLEYRSWHLLPMLMNHLDQHLHRWTLPVLCHMALLLAIMGVGDSQVGTNQFGPVDNLSSPDFTGLVERIALEASRRYLLFSRSTDFPTDNATTNTTTTSSTLGDNYTDTTNCDVCSGEGVEGSPFDWAGLAFSLTINQLYSLRDAKDNCILAECLRLACSQLNMENLSHSGWVQYYLYQCLYCCDCEKPDTEVAIKRAVPLNVQQSLHIRWLDGILLNAQPQGSEKLQLNVDEVLARVEAKDALINCSVGRSWDEQHCWFGGHVIKSKNLVLEYDHLMPLGPARPKTSGILQLKRRLFNLFGFSVATIHRCYWDALADHDKDEQIRQLLGSFGEVSATEVYEKRSYAEDKQLVDMKHQQRRYDTWPPDRYVVR